MRYVALNIREPFVPKRICCNMYMAMTTLHVIHFPHILDGFEILISHIGQSKEENETTYPKVSLPPRGICLAKT